MMGDSSEAEEKPNDPVRRSRRRRKSKRESSTEQPSRPAGQSHAQSIYPLVQVKFPKVSNENCVRRGNKSMKTVLWLQENSGFLLNALLKRGLSEEQNLAEPLQAAAAAPDALRADAMTPESEDLDTVAPNSAAPSPPKPHPLALQPQASPILGLGEPLEEELRSKLSELVGRANSKDSSSSDEEEGGAEGAGQREEVRSKERVNGPEVKRAGRLSKSASVREEGRFWERSGAAEGTAAQQEPRRGEKREASRQSKRQHKRDVERRGAGAGVRRSASSASSPALSPSSQEGVLSDNQVTTVASFHPARSAPIALIHCL